MVKYVCNAFHALKVTFANEIGTLCQQLDVDALAVMKISCRYQLNISAPISRRALRSVDRAYQRCPRTRQFGKAT